MLRKSNSKSSHRLRRRKSTSSIHTRQAYFDPEVARQQAQAAATYAFARAYERDDAKMGLNSEVSGNNNMLDQHGVPNQNDAEDQGGRGVRRQQSVRFTGPEAIPRRRSIGTRASQGSFGDKATTTSLRPRAVTNNVPVPAVYRPPSRSSSIGRASIGEGTAQNIVTALAAYDEYYTREDDIASTPSSYRRMRKSKSARALSSPSKAAKVPFNDIISGGDYNTRIWNQVPWLPSQQHETTLRAPKSMSFLRGGIEHMTPAVREDHDNAVQIARDRFLHQIEQQRVREQPSILFRAKARREEKPFRQSLRRGSTNSFGIPIGYANQITQPKRGSLRTKARNASQTIKKKLKELFRRGGDPIEDAKIPRQQVEASTSHGNSIYDTVTKASQDRFPDIPHSDDATISRVASRLPSLYTVPSSQQLKSHNGSVRSQRSDGSGKSRVTSWTSTADNTATSRHAQAEREAQRLSIIQENGTHVSSASFARSRVSNQYSAYPMFHRPQSAQRRGTLPPVPVDSQKVYSALMKRLDENSPIAKLEAQRIISGEKFRPGTRDLSRNTSVSSRHSGRGTRRPATIRHVQADAAEWADEIQGHDETLTPLPQEDDDVFSPKPPLEAGALMNYRDGCSGSSMQRTVTSRVPSNVAHLLVDPSEGPGIPTQQQAVRNELLMKPPNGLRETRSIFFGNSSFTVNRSTSPYRRALAEADYQPAVITDNITIGPSPNRIFFAPPVVHCSDPKEEVSGGPVQSDETYSESVYSRTTSGRLPAAESPQSLDRFRDGSHFGSSNSVVLDDHRTYQPTGPTRRGKSSSESSDRKGSLTPEATMIKDFKEADKLHQVNYALPSMPKYSGHFREYAQIMEEETEVSQKKVGMKKQPVGILQQTMPKSAQLKPILKHKASISLDGFPIPPPPPPPPLPPPVPGRSPLRPMQSRASSRSVDATSTHRTLSAPSSAVKPGSLNNHQLLRLNSLTNINRADTPAKLIKRARRPSNNHDPSPGIGAAVERQFGSAGSRTPCLGAENYSPAEAARSEYYGSSIDRPRETRDTEAQAMGSRVMVDMFLSSRRRRVAGSEESNAFL